MDPTRPTLDLPSELWTQIFDLAADEDVIFQYGLPTCMAESAWFKNVFGKWTLRSPGEALCAVQRRSLGTKKAIMLTCKRWKALGAEFLFRCLFFNEPYRVLSLCKILSSTPHSLSPSPTAPPLGWWTKRIHLTRYYASPSKGTTLADLQAGLISLIAQCPNLQIFAVDWPMDGPTFGCVADALARNGNKSLRTVKWTVPGEALAKVIWALDALPYVLSAHIHFESPVKGDRELASLGAAGDVKLHLPSLQQLEMKGYIADFVEQATGWDIPALRSVSFDCGSSGSNGEMPDVVGFLQRHGADLVGLDLNLIPSLDVANVLDLCPSLKTFAFNADWRMPPPEENMGASRLVNRPHVNLEEVGLHGLLFAFGVGLAGEYEATDDIRSLIVQRSNDMNVKALMMRKNFPRVRRVRALSRNMLVDLNEANGPRGEGGMERWEKWWDGFASVGVRLEDCTGGLLGELPQDEGDDDDEESDEEDEEEEDEEEGLEFGIPKMPEEEPSEHITELRQLLEECRAMGEEREESMFAPMMAMMGMGMGMGMGGGGGGMDMGMMMMGGMPGGGMGGYYGAGAGMGMPGQAAPRGGSGFGITGGGIPSYPGPGARFPSSGNYARPVPNVPALVVTQPDDGD